MHRAALPLLLAPIAALLAIPGCGSSDPASTTTSTTSTTSTTATGTGGQGGQGGEGTGGQGGAGTGGEGGSGGAGTGGGSFSPAPHTPFPTLSLHSEPVFAHPKLVTITFPGYAHKAEVEAFGDAAVTSSWLTAVGAEYGIGPGTHLAKVTLPDAAPAKMTDNSAVALIGARIADGTLPDGTVDDEVIYMLYIPGSTAFTDDGKLCDDFLGYHWDANVNNKHIAYAIVGDCDGPITDTTSTAAHELIETASDAVDALYLDTPESDPWILLSGMENADLCQELPNVTESGFAFQRSWSDAAHKAGGAPCAPTEPGEVFYNVTAQPANVPSLLPGQSATFTLTGWSTAPMADWSLSIDDYLLYDFVPDYELTGATINNGKTATVKLTVPAGTPSGSIGGVLVDSGPGYGRYWPVAVKVK